MTFDDYYAADPHPRYCRRVSGLGTGTYHIRWPDHGHGSDPCPSAGRPAATAPLPPSVSVHPLMTADPFSFSEQVLQSGRSVTHIEKQCTAEGSAGNTYSGLLRRSSVNRRWLSASRPASTANPGAGRLLPFIPGITPDFTQHVELGLRRRRTAIQQQQRQPPAGLGCVSAMVTAR